MTVPIMPGEPQTMTLFEIIQQRIANATGESLEAVADRTRWLLTAMDATEADMQIAVPIDRAQQMIADADKESTLRLLRTPAWAIKVEVFARKAERKITSARN